MNIFSARDENHLKYISLSIRYLAVFLFIIILILMSLDIIRLYKNIENELLSQTDVFSFNVSPALMFNDNSTANTLLNGLSFSPNIISGMIFNNNKELFASYSKNQDSIIEKINIGELLRDERVIRHTKFRLIVASPIVRDEMLLGWIFLDADLIQIREKIMIFTVMNIFIIIFIFMSLYLVSIVSKTNESLVNSENRYRSMAETVPCAIYHCSNDQDWTMHFISPQIEDICGYPYTDFLDNSVRSYASIIKPSFQKHVEDVISDALSEKRKWILDYQVIHSDGSIRWVYEEGVGVYGENDKVDYLDGFIMDNTYRKNTEAALAENEVKYRSLFEEASDAIVILSNDKIVDSNENMCSMFGIEKESIIGKSVTSLSPEYQPDGQLSSEKGFKIIKEVMKGSKQFFEWQHTRNDGSDFFVEVSLNKVQINSQIFLQGIVRDVSDRILMQSELNHTRKLLNNIIDSMPSMLIGVDVEGKITLWNKTAENTTGVVPAEARGKTLQDIFPELNMEMRQIAESIKTRQTQQEQKRPRSTENGTCFEDVTVYPLIANGVEGAVIRIDDVTEHVRLEEMLVQSEKMLSVGGLAAGMAHEINNPLAGMIQTANVMANRLGEKLNIPANQKAAKDAGTTIESIRQFMEARGIPRMIKTINESGIRVAAIVDNMLSFARKTESQVSTNNINDLLDKTLSLAATDYDLKKHYDFKTISIIREYDANLPEIPCEGAKIQQVFLNILRNGAQAMQEEQNSDSRFIIRTLVDVAKNMVCIEIEDNGPGMSEDVRKRIFEPFYTTKPVGIGTGLGLSVSYFIVAENHNGEMTVESKADSGSKFIIRLPISGVVNG